MGSALPKLKLPGVSGSARHHIAHSVVEGAVRREIIIDKTVVRSDVEISDLTLGDAADAYDRAWLTSKTWPSIANPNGQLSIADLFSGSGGLSLGAWEAARAMQLSTRPVLAIDNDEDALEVYRDNFAPEVSFCAPIETLISGNVGAATTAEERGLQKVVASVDLLLAGPPCQGHSDLNNHTRRDDPRNGLISRVVRFAELFSPRHVVIENVQGIRHDKSGAFQTAIEQLEWLGYSTSTFLLEGVDIGLPQRRRRCFLVASKTAIADHSRIVGMHRGPERSFDWACRDLELVQSDRVFESSASVFPENLRRMKFLIANGLYDLPDTERPDCHRLKAHGYQSVYGRLFPDRPAPTITTGFGSPGQGRYTHPRFARTITPHEAARLQFIPDFFHFALNKRKRLQKVIGNSVPSKLAYAVVLDLLLHG